MSFKKRGSVQAVQHCDWGVFASAIFKGKGRAVRLTGTLLITVGLLLIALWGG